MASSIDATKPADNVVAIKADLRSNLAAAKSEIETLQNSQASTTSALDGKVDTSRQVATTNSLTGGGTLAADRTLQLVNDTASPGNNKVYGTSGSGVKGWKDDPAGEGGSSTFTGLTDTPGGITATQYVRGNSGGTALEFVASDLTISSGATSLTVNAASFGAVPVARVLLSSTSAVTVTLANDVPVGRTVTIRKEGTGTNAVTAAAGSGATLTKPSSADAFVTEQYDHLVLYVVRNSNGTSAEWALVG